MPRTDIPVITPPGKYPGTISANAADFTWVVGDTGNNNSFKSTGRELLIVNNVNVGAQTLTILSSQDEQKRTGDITAYSVGPSEYAVFGPFPVSGWRQSDGTVHINPAHADIKLAVFRLPSLV